MRISVVLTIFTFFLLSYLSCKSSKTESDVTSAENFVEVSIEVSGMTCEGCENAIKKNLVEIAGVKEAKASHTDSLALVTFDQSKTSIDEIVKTIENTGYTVGEHELKEKI
jgi:Cu+-exporting ATPase